MGKADSRPAYGGQACEDTLPEGWEEVRAGDILRLFNGFPFKPSDWASVGLPIIRIQNLNNPNAPFNHYPGELATRFRVEGGDLLFAWSGTPGTSFGAHIWSGGPAWLNQHIFRVEFDGTRIDKRFLRLAINRNLESYIAEAHGGVGLAHITKGRFEDGLLVLPPVDEQRRIVAKVEALLARVNAARDRLARVPAILKRFRQSVLAAACSGRLTIDWRSTNPEAWDNSSSSSETRTWPELDDSDPLELPEIPASWRWTRLLGVADAKRPITYVVIKLGVAVPEGIPTLRSSDVRWLHVDTDAIKRIAPGISNAYSRTILRGGELLVTVRGTLGGVAVAPQRVTGANVSREVAVIAPKSGVEARFLAQTVASPWAQAWLSEVAKGVAYTGVNIRDLKRLPVPIPPFAEQHEIVRCVETLFARADTIEQRAAAALRHADRLTQSVLSKAFRGELVVSDGRSRS